MDALGARAANGWRSGSRRRTFRYGRQARRVRGRFDRRDLNRASVRCSGALDVAGRATLAAQLSSDRV
jgi:hypothetical protein